eukprot:6199148-Prymnesium_polylepis.1
MIVAFTSRASCKQECKALRLFCERLPRWAMSSLPAGFAGASTPPGRNDGPAVFAGPAVDSPAQAPLLGATIRQSHRRRSARRSEHRARCPNCSEEVNDDARDDLVALAAHHLDEAFSSSFAYWVIHPVTSVSIAIMLAAALPAW